MDISVETFDKICRTCLSESTDMKSVFTKLDGEDRTLVDLFTFTANICIEFADILPKHVCKDCEDSIQKADAFKRQCLESQKALRKIANLDEIDNKIVVEVKKHEKEPFLDQVDVKPKTDDQKVFSDLLFSSFNAKEEWKDPENIKQESLENISIEFDEHFSNNDEFPSFPNVVIKKIHKCGCAKQFKSKETFKEHQKTCDIKIRKKKQDKYIGIKIKSDFPCVNCDAVFTSLSEYREHLKVHKDVPNIVTTDEGQKLECPKCFHKFKNQKSLNRHLKRHETCDNIRHQCQKCKREFKYRSHLDSHIIAVHMNNEIVCDICNEKFLTKKGLEVHRDEHHSKKKHNCPHCNKSFVMLCTLKDHLRSHTGEKPYLCSTCGKGFSQKTNLAQHTRRHMGLKPFKCETCPKSFVSKGELDAHTRKHSGAHPFVCDDCGNGFTTSSALVKHRRTHTGERPYQCDLCPMRFAASGTLMNHRRTHTGERPYKCNYCEKAFVQRTDMISHVRCHTGERPYVCSQCGQSFRKTATLKAHIKMHGKEVLHGVGALLGVEAPIAS